jgi:PTS system mannose-specific IIA component
VSVGLVLVTHGDTGASLIAEAEFVLGQPLENVKFVKFRNEQDHSDELFRIHAAMADADSGDGVLVLTDLIGASPSNRVSSLLEHFDALMVTGVNLAMLVCAWSYRDRPLGALVRKAVECGRRGVKIVQR